MITALEPDLVYALTEGAIAVNNLTSARHSAWGRFWRDPLWPGVAECIVEQEQLTVQFVGDMGALDRLDALVHHLDRVDAESPRSVLIRAQVAAMSHRFAEAREHLREISDWRELSDAANRLSLSIDQACGTNLEAVLSTRRTMAESSGRLGDLVPLAALYADLGEFDGGCFQPRLFNQQGAMLPTRLRLLRAFDQVAVTKGNRRSLRLWNRLPF